MTLDAMCAATDVLVYNTFNAAAASSFHFGNAGGASTEGAASWMAGSAMVAPPVSVPMPAEEEGEKVQAGRRKRRRRAKVCRNREDAESQRMTHIAVERNRRRQMNDYLAELRSLMPESYAHRVRTFQRIVILRIPDMLCILVSMFHGENPHLQPRFSCCTLLG
jgi:hypothetical protein